MPEETTPEIFFDTHCHLFNILDVPLYESLAGLVNKDTLSLLLVAMGIPIAIAADLPHKKLEEYRNFLKFFERDARANIHWFAKQLHTATEETIYKTLIGKIQRIVITPLVMDFDTNIQTTDLGFDYKSSEHQFQRLRQAILDTPDCQIEIYPFMGFALDKLNDPTALTRLQDWWQEFGYSSTERARGFQGPLQPPGKAIGIKLYPPLGFNPCPENLPATYYEFYKWCIENDLPLTVHCQESSYCVNAEERAKCNANTHPRNWQRLLEKHSELRGLRINFGHFGGERQLKKLVETGDNNRARGLNRNSWCYTLLQLLDAYPNTYADLAAYDYSSESFQTTLGSILAGSTEALSEPLAQKIPDICIGKLIWGSDVPMILAAESLVEDNRASYKKYLECFVGSLQDLPGSQTNLKKKICHAVMRANPAQFLFGTSA